MNTESPQPDTAADHTWDLSEQIEAINSQKALREKHITEMLDQLLTCNEPEEIKKAFEHYLSQKYTTDDILIVLMHPCAGTKKRIYKKETAACLT